MITIPRLELEAAVLAVRLKNKILDEIDIKIDSVRFWTDSQITYIMLHQKLIYEIFSLHYESFK